MKRRQEVFEKFLLSTTNETDYDLHMVESEWVLSRI